MPGSMNSASRRSKTTNLPNKSKKLSQRKTNDKDIILLLVISILNAGSGYTTIQGALRIVPGAVGFCLGGTIQLILFLLLSGFTAKHAPLRKWFAALVFAFLSVYTSFFTYYDNITEGSKQQRAYDKAVTAHRKLVQEVYTPMKTQLEQLESEAIQNEKFAKDEIDGFGITGEKGHGDKTKEYKAKAIELRLEATKLKSRVKVLQGKFEYQLNKKLTPEEIFKKDNQALAGVPSKWRNGYQLKRNDYIDTEVEISLLTPYYKVVKRELPALASLFIAVTVDGIIILLGTAIDKKRKTSPITVGAHSMATTISEIKGARLTLNEALKSKGTPIPRPDQRTGLDNAIDVVTLRLQGRGSMFLQNFYEAIDPETYEIDYHNSLRDNANPSFALGYRMLLDHLRSPHLGWVTLKNGNWSVVESYYSILSNWLNTEIVRQCNEECSLENKTVFVDSDRDIPFQIPIFSYK